MKNQKDIDELLNAFIDGELPRRKQVEVKRLVNHDPEIAKRLTQLNRCKMLLNSIPVSKAPPGMLQNIKDSLERNLLLEEQPEQFSDRKGARQLFLRKVLTSAAMIALVAGLLAVIYSIVAPPQTSEKLVGPEWTQQLKEPGVLESKMEKTETVKAEGTYTPFESRLVLKTDNLVAVDAFVNRAIMDNGLFGTTTYDGYKDRSYYEIKCDLKYLEPLLVDLKNVWQQCLSATLFLETDQFAKPLEIKEIDPRQIMQIAAAGDVNKRIKIAKDFVTLNNFSRQIPGGTVFPSLQEQEQNLITVPKPVLTSPSKDFADTNAAEAKKNNISLTIIIESTG